MPVVYYAGPLFTDAERSWNNANVSALRAALPGLDLLVPQEFCACHDQAKDAEGKPDFNAIFHDCADHVAKSDAVLAILDGADPDSGTAWEMGYAHAKGIPIIGWRTDWRPGEDGACNCMLTQSCDTLVKDLDGVIAALREWSAALASG